MDEKIGEQLIRLELLSFEQAEKVLDYQKRNKGMKFGEIAVKLGFVDEEQIKISTQ